jgi:alkanesulfonate monooxygenase SsuD/methylene tetrahydromethanopterin reductase-like flavin-dependent oxidoreductase (luciferase family)
LKFGISCSPFLWWIAVEQFEEWIGEVENLGYDAIFIPDHYMAPVPPFPSNKLLDAWSILSYIAAKTKNVKIGSCVSPLPRYVPSQLAKVISTVDLLSNGRVIAGLGAGSKDFPEEFVNYSPHMSFDEAKLRVEKFLEGLELMIKLWTEDKVTFCGKFYKAEGAVLLPKPIQKPHPPIWSGGQGLRMLKITAKFFDGWIPHMGVTPNPQAYQRSVKTIEHFAEEYGRDVSKITFALEDIMRLYGLTESQITEKFRETLRKIEEYREAGCQYYVVEFLPPPKPDERYAHTHIELLQRFAREIMLSF